MKRDTTLITITALVLATFSCALPQAARAQSLGDLLKNSVKRATKEEVENKADQATRKVVRCALGDEQCIKAAKKSGAKVETYEPASIEPAGTEPAYTEPASTATASATTTHAAPARAVAPPAARSIPAGVTPVSSGPAVPLAQMQASCDASAIGRTAALRKDATFNPGFAGAAAVLAKIKPVFAGFAPNGFETHTGGSVSDPEYGMPAYMRTWDFHVLGYAYACLSNGKFFKNTHYAFSAHIGSNFGLGRAPYVLPFDFNPGGSGDGTEEDSRFGFHTLWDLWMVDGLPQPKNGYFHFPDEYSDTYWFTRGGRLPFAYVSREEFLRKQIGILQTGLAHKRKSNDIEIARVRVLGHQVDETANNKLYEAMYEKPIARYQQLLKQPAAWLQQQAAVRLNVREGETSYEFLNASQIGPNVQVPIKPDPAYLDSSKAPGEPQYLVIRLNNQQRRGEYYLLRDLVEQNIEVFKSLVH